MRSSEATAPVALLAEADAQTLTVSEIVHLLQGADPPADHLGCDEAADGVWGPLTSSAKSGLVRFV
jgi:hypothetical protein